MTADDQEGHSEARTRADPPENQPGAGASAPSSAAIEAGGALPGPSVEDLLAGSPDVGAVDLLSAAAEMIAAPRRARGRPPGSGNRKNPDMIAYLAALGHRDPWVTLSMIQTADTAKLAEALRVPMQENGRVRRDPVTDAVLYNPPDLAFAISLQERAATTLMKYHHAAKPQQLELPEGSGSMRPVMVFGDINVTTQSDRDFWSLGAEKPNEINGEAVRLPDDNRKA